MSQPVPNVIAMDVDASQGRKMADSRDMMPRHHMGGCYAVSMRTTVTLDSDTEAIIRARMRRRGQSFKAALNDAIRESEPNVERPVFATETASMGVPRINLDRALRIAAELEDDETVHKVGLGR